MYEQLHPSLWRYVHRMVGDEDTADDVVQESFVRLLKRPDLTGDDARLWVFTVATNLVRDHGRTVSRRRKLLEKNPIERPEGVHAQERLERTESVARVRAALDQLSERDQQLLLMREEGFRYHEIAEVVGVAPTSIGTLISRAVTRFTEVYTPVEG